MTHTSSMRCPLAYTGRVRRASLLASLCGCAALFVAEAAGAQVTPAASAAERRGAPLPDRLAPATRAAIERLADSLDAERLPGHALRDKAAEGVLKGADDARILTAVTALATRLRDSRVLLGATAAGDELIAAAGALYAGVPKSGITQLVRAQRARVGGAGGMGNASSGSLGMPLTVLAELASARVPTDVALRSIDALLMRGARDVDFAEFRRSVEREIRLGRPPKDAVTNGVQLTLRGLGRVP